MTPETLEALAEAVADRVLDGLAEREARRRTDVLLTAAQVAAHYNVAPSWVYEYADELGVIRLGSGDRPRLRFDPEVVAERLAPSPDTKVSPLAATPSPPRQRRRSPGLSTTPLLPIRGRPDEADPCP